MPDFMGYDALIDGTGEPLGKPASASSPGRGHRRGIDLVEAVRTFGDPDFPAGWLEGARWGDGPVTCPKCGDGCGTRVKHPKTPCRCRSCRKHFSIKTGMPTADSNLPLGKWLLAAYRDLTNLKGVSSMKLSRDLRIKQTWAWFMLQRLREAFMPDNPSTEFFSGGEFQVDEAHIGGLEGNKHSKDKIPGGQGGSTKVIVIGVTHTGSGKVWADVIPDTRADTIANAVHRIIPPGSTLYTDEGGHHRGIDRERRTVNHNRGEYVRIIDLANGMRKTATTNGVESMWSMLSRSIASVYHKISPKHLRRYAKTFAGRWNIRSMDTEDRMPHVFQAMFGRAIAYGELIADNGLPSGFGRDGAYHPERLPARGHLNEKFSRRPCLRNTRFGGLGNTSVNRARDT